MNLPKSIVVSTLLFLNSATPALAESVSILRLWVYPSLAEASKPPSIAIKRKIIGSWIITDTKELNSASICNLLITSLDDAKVRKYHKRVLQEQIKRTKEMLAIPAYSPSSQRLERHLETVKQESRDIPQYWYFPECVLPQKRPELTKMINING